MKPTRSLLLLMLTVSVPSFECLAQLGEEPLVSLSFKTMAWDRYPDADIYFRSDNKEQKIELLKMVRSRPYKYYGPATLVFYTKESGPEGQTINSPVASATFKQHTKDPLILFIKNPNPEDKRRYINWLIDDNTDDFPYGSYQVFNLSKEQLRGRIDEEVFQLDRSGSHTIVQLSGDKRNVMAIIQVIWEGKWENASRSVWTYKPNQRNLVFILSSDNPNYSFFDMKIVPETERKTGLDVTLVPESSREDNG